MMETGHSKRERKVALAVGMMLIVLIVIFAAKKGLLSKSASSKNSTQSAIEEIFSSSAPAQEDPANAVYEPIAAPIRARAPAAAVGEDVRGNEISISMGGDGTTGPVMEEAVLTNVLISSAEDIEPYEEVIEPVQEEDLVIYIVQSGDTLSTIAQQFYGISSKYLLIARANGLRNANVLRVGMELVIPDVQNVHRPLDNKSDVRVPTKAKDKEKTTEIEKNYIVKKNDSLWRIAAAAYGDGSRWKQVFDANRDSLRDKDSIRVGQVLRLP